MIFAIIVGVILLLVAYLAPVPEPGRRILIVVGWILVALSLVLLVVGLLQGPTYIDSALALYP